MTTYLRRFQNTVPLKSQNWTDFMARHPRYANGAWNWVTQREKREEKNLFSSHFSAEKSRDFFFFFASMLALHWSLISKPTKWNKPVHSRQKQPHKKVDDISQLISEYMGLRNVTIHGAKGKNTSLLMDTFDNVSKIVATGVIKTVFCYWICSNEPDILIITARCSKVYMILVDFTLYCYFLPFQLFVPNTCGSESHEFPQLLHTCNLQSQKL